MSERFLLVLAQAGDPAIQALRQLLPQRLAHAGIADLSSSGWRCVVGCPELATAAAGGRLLRAEQIAAVWCRLTTITPQDLTHLHADDRDFTAGEMHAFLRAWLSQFGERVCNQPNSTSLAGPAWLPMRWRWLAARSGIPTAAAANKSLFVASAFRRKAAAAEQIPTLHTSFRLKPEATLDEFLGSEAVTVLVAGHQVLGTRDARLIRYALSLARAVRSTLLTVRFVKQDDWRFVSADPNPPLDGGGAAALVEWAFGSQLQFAAAGAR